MIRVVILCDRALVRTGIERMLDGRPEVMVVGTAATRDEAIGLTAERQAEVVVVDLTLPVQERVRAVAELCRNRGRARILVLGAVDAAQQAQAVLEAGASGFLWNGAELDELIAAIRTVQRGESYVSAQASPAIDGMPVAAAAAAAATALSKRELEVMCFLASGMTNREIASQLGISVKTIDTHRGHVLKKLQLRNNSDITRYAIRHGLIRV